MTQNFDIDELREMEQAEEDKYLDDEYWKNYYDSQREEEAIIEHYDKTHNQ